VDATLPNIQKQAVFGIVQANGVDPHQFEWMTVPSTILHAATISRINSKQRKDFFFAFDFFQGEYQPHCSPWQGVRQQSFGPTSWDDCVRNAGEWARLVRAELNTPDPWKALPGIATQTHLAVAPNVANTEFSHLETERLAQGIDQIRRLFNDAVGTSNEKLGLIDQQLNTLLDASKRMGRKDWVNQAIGALITLSITLGLQPEVTKQAFEILTQTHTGLVHLMPPVIATTQQLM